MPETTALDAINEALGTAGTPADPPENEDAANVGSDDTALEEPGTGDEGSGEGEEASSEGEDAAGDAEGAGDAEIDPKTGKPVEKGPNGERERNPDGTWKKAEPVKKAPDPVNDPIDTKLKKETQDRIRTLIDTTKTVTAERDELKQNFDYMVQGVQATGTTPEQYGEVLSWMSLFNSGVPEQQAKALELIENVADRLATLLGKERTVGDPLKAHADLSEAVRTGKISPEYAKEIARTRNSQTFRTELTTTAQTQQQQQQQAQAIERQARSDLTALEDNLRSVDGKEYDAIKASIVPILKPIMAALPPAQWKEKFTAAYKAEKDRRAAARAAAPARSAAPANQPLRAGKNPAGGQSRAPANALEAMNGALASMK